MRAPVPAIQAIIGRRTAQVTDEFHEANAADRDWVLSLFEFQDPPSEERAHRLGWYPLNSKAILWAKSRYGRWKRDMERARQPIVHVRAPMP